MCEMSKIPAACRTARCSSRMPVYWIGISPPPRTRRGAPPSRTCASNNGVRFNMDQRLPPPAPEPRRMTDFEFSWTDPPTRTAGPRPAEAPATPRARDSPHARLPLHLAAARRAALRRQLGDAPLPTSAAWARAGLRPPWWRRRRPSSRAASWACFLRSSMIFCCSGVSLRSARAAWTFCTASVRLAVGDQLLHVGDQGIELLRRRRTGVGHRLLHRLRRFLDLLLRGVGHLGGFLADGLGGVGGRLGGGFHGFGRGRRRRRSRRSRGSASPSAAGAGAGAAARAVAATGEEGRQTECRQSRRECAFHGGIVSPWLSFDPGKGSCGSDCPG
jgi:hypothetical protein